MATTTSISIILCTIAVILAYLGRTVEKDYLRGMFSVLTIYFLTALAAVARSFSETELGVGAVTDLIGYAFIAMALVSLFITFMMVIDYLLVLFRYLKNRKKGFGGKDMEQNHED